MNPKARTLLLYSCLTAFFLGTNAGVAALPGYEGETAKFLSFIVETHQKETSTKGEHNEQSLWQEVFLNLETSKGVTRVVYGPKRPVDFTQPNIVVLLSGNEATQIDHDKKQVFIDSIQPTHQDGSAFLYAGRLHHGVSLASVVKSLSHSPIQHEKIYTLSAPYFNSEIEISLDRDQRVIAIEEGERSYQFQWNQLAESEFEYVESLHVVYDFGFRRIEINEWVRECKAYPELPNQFFQYEWPNDYSVRDLRKKPAPPLTLSN